MSSRELNVDSCKKLRQLFTAMTNSMADTVKTLIDQSVSVSSGNFCLVDAEDWVMDLPGEFTVARGGLDKDFAGRYLLFTFDPRDATALAGYLMMTPAEVIEERRKQGSLDEEDLEAFGEVGNVLCSGVDSVMREILGSKVGLRLHDHGRVRPSLDSDKLIGEGELLGFEYKLKIADYPETKAWILVDSETAESWNGSPIVGGGNGDETESSDESNQIGKIARDLEDIPARDVRGRMATYMSDNALMDTVRRACRRAGLELDRHSRTEIPNPAAHRDEIILIDIPVGDDKRFEWVKRIKSFNAAANVVILIHRPSRKRVLQGFMAKADVILPWPVKDTTLAEKLECFFAAQPEEAE